MAYISWQLVQVGVLTTKVLTTEKVVLMDMNMMNTISSLKELGIFMVRRRCFCFSAVCARARAHEFVQIRCAVILFLNVWGGQRRPCVWLCFDSFWLGFAIFRFSHKFVKSPSVSSITWR